MKRLVDDAGLSSEIHIDSAGTAAYHVGEAADRRSAEVARSRGVELTSRARKFERGDFARFDYVLAMDRSNLSDLMSIAPDAGARDKIRLLRSFDPTAPENAPVPDPYYGGPSGFEDVYDICERACRGLLEHISEG